MVQMSQVLAYLTNLYKIFLNKCFPIAFSGNSVDKNLPNNGVDIGPIPSPALGISHMPQIK